MKKAKTQILITVVFACLFSMISFSQRGPIGGPVGGPVDPGGPIGPAPIMVPDQTPPCNVSDNCNDEPNYMPVWRYNATTRTVDQCPSPLFVRKDLYTCQRISRIFNFGPAAGIDPNASYINNCPQCNIGFVGINAIEPEEQLHVIGNVRCDNGTFMGDVKVKNIFGVQPSGIVAPGTQDVIEVYAPINFQTTMTASNGTFSDLSVSNLNTGSIVASSIDVPYLNVSNYSYMKKLSIGNLTNGIPKRPNGAFSNYALSVDGTIVATKTIVQISSWADKVFQKNYSLMPLSEVEAYVAKNKHLPEIPSESEVIENGVDVAEMNKLLLQKVEELTLHLIEQNKKIEKLEAKVKGLIK